MQSGAGRVPGGIGTAILSPRSLGGAICTVQMGLRSLRGAKIVATVRPRSLPGLECTVQMAPGTRPPGIGTEHGGPR